MTSPSVLIIDDDPAARAAVAEDLKREGYNLEFAENGQEGLLAMRDSSPAVIILDLRMPVMDGLEFLDNIDLKPTDPYSIVVLTGHGDADAVKTCYEAGVTTFIKKPFTLYEIRGVVKNAITGKQLTTRLDDMVTERTAELEQRVREVTALNQLSHKALSRASGMEAEFDRISEGLKRLASTTASLSKSTQSLSNLQENGGPTPDSATHGEYRRIMEGLQELAQEMATLAKRAETVSNFEEGSGLQ